jgi:hypothetical protein
MGTRVRRIRRMMGKKKLHQMMRGHVNISFDFS